MTTTIPRGHRPGRYFVWLRFMRIYRKTFVSARSQNPKPLIVT